MSENPSPAGDGGAFYDLMRTTIAQQGEENRKMLAMVLDKSRADNAQINDLAIKMAVAIERLNHIHDTPCPAVVKLEQLHRDDINALYDKVNGHVQDGHAAGINSTHTELRETQRDSRHRLELILIAAGIICSFACGIIALIPH